MRTAVLTAAAIFAFLSGNAQGFSKPKLGINAGLNLANSQVQSLQRGDNKGVNVMNGMGFRLGLMADWRLVKGLSFSPKAELVFNDSKIAVTDSNSKVKEYEVYPVTFDFAGHFTYRLFDKGIAPYILLGPGYRIPLTDDKTLYAAQDGTVFVDFGFGVEKQFRRFNIAPELRYSYGLNTDSDIPVVANLNYHSMVFVVNFKGK